MSAQEQYPEQLQAAQVAAERNVAAIQTGNPWLSHLPALAAVAGASDAPTRLRRLLALADRVNEAISPYSACHRGCAQCCHISVVLSEVEAKAIGTSIGRKPHRVRAQATREGLVHRYFGQPCPFLVSNQCSIYANRPLSCRAHLSIADSPFFCDTAIPPEDSMVPEVDVMALMHGYALAFNQTLFADIRDFFPPNRPRGC